MKEAIKRISDKDGNYVDVSVDDGMTFCEGDSTHNILHILGVLPADTYQPVDYEKRWAEASTVVDALNQDELASIWEK
jgi:hypothetical protein